MNDVWKYIVENVVGVSGFKIFMRYGILEGIEKD